MGIWPLTLRPYSYRIGTTKKKKIRGLPDNFSQNNPGLGLCPGFAHVPMLGPITVAREWGLRRTLVSMHVPQGGEGVLNKQMERKDHLETLQRYQIIT